jgi:hypothetical protein
MKIALLKVTNYGCHDRANLRHSKRWHDHRREGRLQDNFIVYDFIFATVFIFC